MPEGNNFKDLLGKIEESRTTPRGHVWMTLQILEEEKSRREAVVKSAVFPREPPPGIDPIVNGSAATPEVEASCACPGKRKKQYSDGGCHCGTDVDVGLDPPASNPGNEVPHRRLQDLEVYSCLLLGLEAYKIPEVLEGLVVDKEVCCNHTADHQILCGVI